MIRSCSEDGPCESEFERSYDLGVFIRHLLVRSRAGRGGAVSRAERLVLRTHAYVAQYCMAWVMWNSMYVWYSMHAKNNYECLSIAQKKV